MSLSNILKEIQIHLPASQMDPLQGAPHTLNGRIGMHTMATESIKVLRRQYRKQIMDQAVYIVVTGSNRNAFSEISSQDSFGVFSVDPDSFFRDLSSRIDPSLFGRESVSNLFNIASNILEDKMLELDINSYPMLQYNDRYNVQVNNADDFTAVIRTAINEQLGSEIVGISSADLVTGTAITKKHDAAITPIILSTSDERFALDLMKNLKKQRLPNGTFQGISNNVFLVAAGTTSKELKSFLGCFALKNATEETVGQTLTAIRSKVV